MTSLHLSFRAIWMLILHIIISQGGVESFGAHPLKTRAFGMCRMTITPQIQPLYLSENSQPESQAETEITDISASMKSEAFNRTERERSIGNLVADDEWDGLGMELSDLITKAVVEDVKRQIRTFTGKENLKVGDISKEVDRRVKEKVAKLRNKSEYELGDLALAADELAKNYTETLTGKPYQPGDLSIEIDKRIKAKAAEFCGKSSYDEYEFGDVTREILRRIEERTLEFVNKSESYEFGDISREIEKRRRQWVQDFLGEEAAANYKFGSITKKAVADFTGKSDYQFGDITKTLLRNVFGDRNNQT